MRDLLNALYALHPLASGAAEVAVIARAGGLSGNGSERVHPAPRPG